MRRRRCCSFKYHPGSCLQEPYSCSQILSIDDSSTFNLFDILSDICEMYFNLDAQGNWFYPQSAGYTAVMHFKQKDLCHESQETPCAYAAKGCSLFTFKADCVSCTQQAGKKNLDVIMTN